MASNEELLVQRARSVGANLSVSQRSEGGVHAVRAAGCYLFTASGRTLLDAANNVAHVGHANPHVVRCVAEQMQRINSNTRLLSPSLGAYAARLLATFPAPLSRGRVLLVSSGSEANDLAMRVCREHARAGRGEQRTEPPAESSEAQRDNEKDVFICLAHAYHGATNSVIDLSPYKYRSRGGRGRAAHIIEVGVPESMDEAAIDAEMQKLQASIEAAVGRGQRICGFFAESVLSCAGQVFLPPAFLQRIYALVRAAGGLCVADEVQTGFGRLGCWWAFERQGVVPDLVALGKPMGNGYAMAGLVVAPGPAQAFDNGMEYFNTGGGSHAAVAAGMAVMDCIEQQNLLAHSASVGTAFLSQLRELQRRHPQVLHAVRGEGLFLGVEVRTGAHACCAVASSQLVPGRAKCAGRASDESAPPAALQLPCPVRLERMPNYPLPCCSCDTPRAASPDVSTPSSVSSDGTAFRHCSLSSGSVCGWLCAALVHCEPMGVLAGTDGPLHNVLKIKPPLCFSKQDALYFCAALDACIQALLQHKPCLRSPASSSSRMGAVAVTGAAGGSLASRL